MLFILSILNTTDVLNFIKNAITATQAKQEFGELILRSQKSPIQVTKNGKPVAVILSDTDYQQMKKQNLRAALIEGELSGDGGELDIQAIKQEARKQMTDAQNS